MSLADYRSITEAVSYSEIKLFSQCPRLYYEQYVLREFVPEEKDYFLYGHVVDCLLTQPHDLDKRFCVVSSKSSGLLTEHMQEQAELIAKVEELRLPALTNKTKAKSLQKAQRELEEIEEKMMESANIGDRTQVTRALWRDAHETAEVMKKNPFYQANILPLIEGGNTECFQQMLFDYETASKGTLDVLYLRPELRAALNSFLAGEKSKEEVQDELGTKSPDSKDKDGFIVDIKTTKSLRELDPRIYACQLGYYQYMIREILGVNLPCYTVVGDKVQGRKFAQDFVYPQEMLSSKLGSLLEVKKLLVRSLALAKNANEKNPARWFPSAKQLRGKDQACFTCSECSVRPFSTGSPLLVNPLTTTRFIHSNR